MRHSLLSARRLVVALSLLSFVWPTAAAEFAHYRFDTNFNDFSGNNNHGTPTGASVTITGNPGQFVFGGGAANFTSVREWVAMTSPVTITSGSPYSVSFWARDTAGNTASNGGMVIGQPNNTGFFIWLNSPSPDLRWRSVDSTAARQADFTFPDNDGAWHHYVLLAHDFDNDATVDDITLYRDNLFIGSDPNNLTGFIFGAIGEAYDSSLDLDFQGQIDEVRLFDHALSTQQISNLYQFNSLVALPEPVSSTVWIVMGVLIAGAVPAMRVRFRRSLRHP